MFIGLLQPVQFIEHTSNFSSEEDEQKTNRICKDFKDTINPVITHSYGGKKLCMWLYEGEVVSKADLFQG